MKNTTILMMLLFASSTLGVIHAVPTNTNLSEKQSVSIQDEWIISVLRSDSGTRLKVRYKLFMNEVDMISLQAFQFGSWGPVSARKDHATGMIIIQAMGETFYL